VGLWETDLPLQVSRQKAVTAGVATETDRFLVTHF
jgi:hypothetical protein